MIQYLEDEIDLNTFYKLLKKIDNVGTKIKIARDTLIKFIEYHNAEITDLESLRELSEISSKLLNVFVSISEDYFNLGKLVAIKISNSFDMKNTPPPRTRKELETIAASVNLLEQLIELSSKYGLKKTENYLLRKMLDGWYLLWTGEEKIDKIEAIKSLVNLSEQLKDIEQGSLSIKIIEEAEKYLNVEESPELWFEIHLRHIKLIKETNFPSDIHIMLDRVMEAIDYLPDSEKGKDLKLSIYGETADYLSHTGKVKNIKKAIMLYEQAEKLANEIYGEDSSIAADIQMKMGVALTKLNTKKSLIDGIKMLSKWIKTWEDKIEGLLPQEILFEEMSQNPPLLISTIKLRMNMIDRILPMIDVIQKIKEEKEQNIIEMVENIITVFESFGDLDSLNYAIFLLERAMKLIDTEDRRYIYHTIKLLGLKIYQLFIQNKTKNALEIETLLIDLIMNISKLMKDIQNVEDYVYILWGLRTIKLSGLTSDEEQIIPEEDYLHLMIELSEVLGFLFGLHDEIDNMSDDEKYYYALILLEIMEINMGAYQQNISISEARSTILDLSFLLEHDLLKSLRIKLGLYAFNSLYYFMKRNYKEMNTSILSSINLYADYLAEIKKFIKNT